MPADEKRFGAGAHSGHGHYSGTERPTTDKGQSNSTAAESPYIEGAKPVAQNSAVVESTSTSVASEGHLSSDHEFGHPSRWE